MNYTAHYNSLIAKRQQEPSNELCVELHHIIPRAHGGSDVPENIVRLSAREHYLAHWLLAKIYGGSMWAAFWMMCSTRKGHRVPSHVFATARANMAESKRGKKAKPETIAKRSKALTGLKRTEAQRRRYSESKKGWRMTAEQRQHLSEIRKGRVFSEQARMNMSAGHKKPCTDARRKGIQEAMHKPETHQRLVDASSRPIVVNGKLYHSTQDAADVIGIKRQTLNAWVCKGVPQSRADIWELARVGI